MTRNLDTATDDEILAAIRGGALAGDRVDLALRYGRHLIETAAAAQAHAVQLAEQHDANVATTRALETAHARLDATLDRVSVLEALLRRARVNGGAQVLREAGLA